MITSADEQFRVIEKAELTNIVELQRKKLENAEIKIYEDKKELEKLKEMLVESVRVSEHRGETINEMKDVIQERDDTIRFLRESANSLSDQSPDLSETPEYITALRTIAKLEFTVTQLRQSQFDSEQQLSTERDAHSEKTHHLEAANKELISIVEQLKQQKTIQFENIPTEVNKLPHNNHTQNSFQGIESDFQRALHSNKQKQTINLMNDNSCGGGATDDFDLLHETTLARNRIELQSMVTSNKMSLDMSNRKVSELSTLLKQSECKRHELENEMFIANSKIETHTDLLQEVDAMRTAHSTMSETTFKSLSRGAPVTELVQSLGDVARSIYELDSEAIQQSCTSIQKSTSLQKLIRHQYDRTRRLFDEMTSDHSNEDNVAPQLLDENIELTSTIGTLQLRITSLLQQLDHKDLLQNSLQQEIQATKTMINTSEDDQPFLVFIDVLKDIISAHRQLAAEQNLRIQHQTATIENMEQTIGCIPDAPLTITEIAPCESCFTNTVCISNLEDENSSLKLEIGDLNNDIKNLKNQHQAITIPTRTIVSYPEMKFPQLPPVETITQQQFLYGDGVSNECLACQQKSIIISDLQQHVDILKRSPSQFDQNSIEEASELQKKLQSVMTEKSLLSEKWETLVNEHGDTMRLTKTALESKKSQIAHLRDLLKNSSSQNQNSDGDSEVAELLKETLSQWGVQVDNPDAKTLAKAIHTLPVPAIRDAVSHLAKCMYIPCTDDATIDGIVKTITRCKNKAEKQQNSLINEKEKRRSSITEVTTIKDRIRELEICEAVSRRGSLAYSVI